MVKLYKLDNDTSFRTDPGVGAVAHDSWTTQKFQDRVWKSTPNAFWQTEFAGNDIWGFDEDTPSSHLSVEVKRDVSNLEETNTRLTAENEQLRKECLEQENQRLRQQCAQAQAQKGAAEVQAKAAESVAAMYVQGYTIMGPNGASMAMAGMPVLCPMMPGLRMQPSAFMMPGVMPGVMPNVAFPGMTPGQMPTTSGAGSGQQTKCKIPDKADVDFPPAVPDGGPATTLMLRNLPNDYTRDMMLKLLDKQGFAGSYDFFYLPIDFKSNAGLGYGFINLVSADKVKPFWDAFSGFSSWSLPSHKICSVGWSNPHQGLRTHIERFKNSFLMHEDVPDQHKPVLFSGGVRIAFPPPTRKLQPPKLRQGSR